MEVASTIESIRAIIRAYKKEGKTIGFVPTMGAMHGGHLSLIKLAKKKCDNVVVSIYVNPEQFAPDEDFDEYPRSMETDLQKCKELGVSAVFTPSDDVMYRGNQYLKIKVSKLNRYMDGGSRPGFFEGVLLVVNKLFNIVDPDIAIFGQKDIQQFRILQQMVREFNHDVQLAMGPIIRADDGLALSSRNKYLNDQERKLAPSLYRSLRYSKKQIQGNINNVNLLLKHQKAELEAKKFKIDYLNLYSFDQLIAVKKIKTGNKYILAGAVYLGETRLIDNMIIEL